MRPQAHAQPNGPWHHDAMLLSKRQGASVAAAFSPWWSGCRNRYRPSFCPTSPASLRGAQQTGSPGLGGSASGHKYCQRTMWCGGWRRTRQRRTAPQPCVEMERMRETRIMHGTEIPDLGQNAKPWLSCCTLACMAPTRPLKIGLINPIFSSSPCRGRRGRLQPCTSP